MVLAVIAEYNPLHNGHLKQIKTIKDELSPDTLVVLMSGNFTQRGEAAILDKFTRAEQAIKAGADVVLELPTVFATANAELFATGAVKILNDTHAVDGLCFGVESGTVEDYFSAARALLSESKDLKALIQKGLDEGLSPAKARYNAVKTLGGEEIKEELLSSPNNVLALEYTKAVLKLSSPITLYPLLRTGDHNDGKLHKGITSARSIREQLKKKKIRAIKSCVPPYVFSALPDKPLDFSNLTMARLYQESAESLAGILDCTEGLENRIKALIVDNPDLEVAVDKIATKRYTYARVRRIVTAALLGIREKTVLRALQTPLYTKVLAVAEDKKDAIRALSEKAEAPVLTRKSDYSKIKKGAEDALAVDALAGNLYGLVSGKKQNEYQMLVVKR